VETSRARWLAQWLAGHELTPDGLRPALLRRVGHRVGNDVVIFAGLHFGGESTVAIGRGTLLSRDVFLDCSAPVVIGERTALAVGVRIITSGHDYSDPRQRSGARHTATVRIGDGCWIGAGSTVLPDVTIGDGVLIAAGAVVTTDCAADGLYAGVPARRVRDLPTGRHDVQIPG
jgi:maltose O-acetyltransferase